MTTKEPKPRGTYIPYAMDRHFLNGDAYIQMDEIYPLCKKLQPTLSYSAFRTDLAEQLRLGKLRREGSRLYLTKTLRYENSAAGYLADILSHNDLPAPELPPVLTAAEGFALAPEQWEAVKLALSRRLSIILGGAGTGKSTLIHGINQYAPGNSVHILCAPTGKAARNLTERTGIEARTVHSALGMRPDDDFLSPVVWEYVKLVIVDEAGMITLEMLAGILCKIRRDCRVVLIGDPNQLLSVGSGNVLPDLLALGIPSLRLEQNHRQEDARSSLWDNVVNFSRLHTESELVYDDTFQLKGLQGSVLAAELVKEAAKRYLRGENVQVLSPYNRATDLSVQKLNAVIRELVNPPRPEKKELENAEGEKFRTGDRVIITRNDRDRNCSNGDVGLLLIAGREKKDLAYTVLLPDGRCPTWDTPDGLEHMALAYALTVHKSQGGQYDSILMPVSDRFNTMLYRNLIYTAISRGKKQVVLYGSRNALGVAIQKPAPKRRSKLVEKTRMNLLHCA